MGVDNMSSNESKEMHRKRQVSAAQSRKREKLRASGGGQVTLPLTKGARARLRRLQRRHGLSQSEVIERLLRSSASDRELTPDDVMALALREFTPDDVLALALKCAQRTATTFAEELLQSLANACPDVFEDVATELYGTEDWIESARSELDLQFALCNPAPPEHVWSAVERALTRLSDSD